MLFVFVWCIRFCYFWQVDAKQYNTIGGLLMHIAAPVPGRVSSLYYDLTQSFVAIGTVIYSCSNSIQNLSKSWNF